MNHASLRIINDEHSSLAAMLQSMRMMIERGPDDEPELFFDILRAMLFYVDEVPEKQHHKKETVLFFPLVARRSQQCDELIQRLNQEHANGEAKVRELQHLLLAWEILGDSRRQIFETEFATYFGFYMEHMHLEKTIIIPEALRVLSESDWATLNSAFSLNNDPLSISIPRDPIYDRLFTRITMRTPEPIGLGMAHRAVS